MQFSYTKEVFKKIEICTHYNIGVHLGDANLNFISFKFLLFIGVYITQSYGSINL